MKRGHDFYQMPSHQREFLDEVKGDVEKMRKLYGSLIENAQIGDLTASSKDGFQTNVTASALVLAAQNLLRKIQELKLSAVVLDYDAAGKTVEALAAEAGPSRARFEESLRDMKTMLAAQLREVKGDGDGDDCDDDDDSGGGGEKKKAAGGGKEKDGGAPKRRKR